MSSVTSSRRFKTLSVFFFLTYSESFRDEYLIPRIRGNTPEPWTRFVKRRIKLTLFSLLFLTTSAFIIWVQYYQIMLIFARFRLRPSSFYRNVLRKSASSCVKTVSWHRVEMFLTTTLFSMASFWPMMRTWDAHIYSAPESCPVILSLVIE